MASFNKVILAGNLTRDPEIRYTPKGTAVTKFSIAVNRKWKGDDGHQREEVTFVDIDSFGAQAETIAKWLKRGSGILVEGRLKLDQWDDKQTGQKRSRLGVVLESFTFLDSKGTQSQGNQAAPPPRRPAASSDAGPTSSEWPAAGADTPGTEPPSKDDDDVPF